MWMTRAPASLKSQAEPLPASTDERLAIYSVHRGRERLRFYPLARTTRAKGIRSSLRRFRRAGTPSGRTSASTRPATPSRSGRSTAHTSERRRRFGPGGSWSQPATLSQPAAAALQPQVAFNPRGHAVAAWASFDGRPTSPRARAVRAAASGAAPKRSRRVLRTPGAGQRVSPSPEGVVYDAL